jgi:MFS family permease
MSEVTGGTRPSVDRPGSRMDGRPARRVGRIGAAVTVLIFDDLAQNILLPVLPYYHRHLHLTAGQLGITLAAEPAMVLVASPFIGRCLESRTGWHRPALGLGLVLFADATVSYGLASSWGLLVFARLVHGLAVAATFPPTFASVADLAVGRERIRLLTLVNTLTGLGALATPAVSGLLVSSLHLPWAFVVVAIAILAATPILVTLLRTNPLLPASKSPPQEIPAATRCQAAALLAASLTMAEIGVVQLVMPLVISARLGFGPAAIGAYLTAVGIGFAAPQLLIPALARRWGDSRVLGTSAVLTAAMMGTAASSPPWLLAAVVGVLGLPLSGLFGTATALIGEDPRSAGAFGRLEGAIALGLLLGSLGGGAALGKAGQQAALGLGATVAAAAALPLTRWGRQGRGPA